MGVDLPRTLDRPWATFPSYEAIGTLGAQMDFMNSAGVLLPMDLWGRRLLLVVSVRLAFYPSVSQ